MLTYLRNKNERTTATMRSPSDILADITRRWEDNKTCRGPLGEAYVCADGFGTARTADEMRRSYAEFREAKMKLPAVIPGAVWPTEDVSAGIPHTLSGYMVLDYDHPDKHKPQAGELIDANAVWPHVERLMALAKASPHTFMAYRSPSRMGVKVVVRLTGHPTNVPIVKGGVDKGEAAHVRRSYYATYAAAAKALDLGEVDEGAKDPERLTFLAHDHAGYLNENAIPIAWVEAPRPDEFKFQGDGEPHHHHHRADADATERAIGRIVAWYQQRFPLSVGLRNDNSYAWAWGFLRNGIDDATAAHHIYTNMEGEVPEGIKYVYGKLAAARAKGVDFDPWAFRGAAPPEDKPPPPPRDEPKGDGLRRWSVADLHAASDTLPPLLTGLTTFDAKLAIKPGGVVLIGAEPGAGKSMFLLNIMMSAARRNPSRSFIFYSAEMSPLACMVRLALAMAPPKGADAYVGGPAYVTNAGHLERTTAHDVITKGIDDRRGTFIRNTTDLVDELLRLAAVEGVSVYDMAARWADGSHLTMSRSYGYILEGLRCADELVGAGRIILADHPHQLIPLGALKADLEVATPLPLGAVFIDYATRIEGEGNTGKEQRHAVVDTSKQLTAIVKERQVPVFLASQIGREAFKREPKNSTRGDERKVRAERPTSHFDALALRPMAVADGDVFAESAQWYRDADTTIILHNPLHGANRAAKDYLSTYRDGVYPFFVRIGKVRKGAPVHDILELGVDPDRQLILPTCPLPTTAPRGWFTKADQDKHVADQAKAAKAKSTKNTNPIPQPI